jgi:hypothetical protein
VARGAFAALVLVLAASGEASAQEKGIGTPPSREQAAQMIAAAQTQLAAGEESFKRGDFGHARTAFDSAMDMFLMSGYDIRADASLQAAYRDTVERVHRYQTIGVGAEGDTVWPDQAYEATKDDFRPEDVPLPDLVAAAANDFANASFLVRVAELQRRFRETFKRDFTLTGRDTGVHARLYGHGRAADVRVRDLTPAQVSFIVSHARALNMRVLDFSTAERVYAHNARVLSLGRPLDTLSTGMHLHLNDQPRRAANYSAQPAAKQRIGRSRSK